MQKVAMVSASSRGIGKQIGLDLLDKGYFVYFNGHTQESINDLDYNNLSYYKTNQYNIICQDLSTLEGNLETANYLKSQDKYLDVLILNIGITDRTLFGNISYESWQKIMNTNLNFPFFLVQSLATHIKENGKIIFISSVLATHPKGKSIVYAVYKAGINTLIKHLAKEFAYKKITVNAIAPGFIGDTEWHKNKTEEQIEKISDEILLKRLGKTKEVSSLVLEVINNQYINGTVLEIDGGYGL